ncbi:MAG: hypothetical protein HY825_19030 [Acidobacteria bacterium]|nr:hypothetical protein [Acidobacteriota bacterium]
MDATRKLVERLLWCTMPQLLLLLGAGCTGTVDTAPGGGGTVTLPEGCTLPGSANVPLDTDGAPPDGTPITLALDSLSVGGPEVGYNLDCQVTHSDSTSVCRTGDGTHVISDGPLGRDNVFGPQLLGVSEPFVIDAGASILGGSWTLVVQFAPGDADADHSGIAGWLFTGRDLGHAPAFDGTDVWPVAQPIATVGGYVTGGIWVSGEPIALTLRVIFEGVPMFVTLHHAILTAELAADRSSATGGVVTGIVDPVEFMVEAHRVGVLVSPALCGWHESYDWRESADILLDGSQDPGRTCDGISAAFAFSMRRVRLGALVPPEQPPADPCPE